MRRVVIASCVVPTAPITSMLHGRQGVGCWEDRRAAVTQLVTTRRESYTVRIQHRLQGGRNREATNPGQRRPSVRPCPTTSTSTSKPIFEPKVHAHAHAYQCVYVSAGLYVCAVLLTQMLNWRRQLREPAHQADGLRLRRHPDRPPEMAPRWVVARRTSIPGTARN